MISYHPPLKKATQHKAANTSTLHLDDALPATMLYSELKEPLNQSNQVQSQLRLQQSLNESPQLVRQTKLAQTLSAGKSSLQPQQLIQRREQQQNKTGLPDKLKAGMENLSGIAMDDVKVHYNSMQPARVQALAYTQGTDIHVGPGQERYLAHEAWHAVQQKQGIVQPTAQTKDLAINDDAALEHEADVMGARAEYTGQSEETRQLVADRSTFEDDDKMAKQTGRRSDAGQLASSGLGGVVQRVVVVGRGADARLERAVKDLSATPAMTTLARSAETTLIVNRSDAVSEASMKTSRNRVQFEMIAKKFYEHPDTVNYMVSINNEQLKGLPVDMSKAYSIPSPEKESKATYGAFGSLRDIEALGLSPELELNILSRFSSDSFKPKSVLPPPYEDLVNEMRWNPVLNKPSSLSLQTVLLHELGHILQYARIPKETLNPKIDLLLQPPDASLLTSNAVIEQAVEGLFATNLWTQIRTVLNAISTWLHNACGYLYESSKVEPTPPSREMAEELRKLIDRAQLQVGLWIEYDVMTNVEHTYAIKKNEPIRTHHGEERALGMEVEEQAVRIFDSNKPKDPSSLGEVKAEMIERAQLLTMALPVTLKKLYNRYQKYAPAAVESLKSIVE